MHAIATRGKKISRGRWQESAGEARFRWGKACRWTATTKSNDPATPMGLLAGLAPEVSPKDTTCGGEVNVGGGASGSQSDAGAGEMGLKWVFRRWRPLFLTTVSSGFVRGDLSTTRNRFQVTKRCVSTWPIVGVRVSLPGFRPIPVALHERLNCHGLLDKTCWCWQMELAVGYHLSAFGQAATQGFSVRRLLWNIWRQSSGATLTYRSALSPFRRAARSWLNKPA